MKVIITTSARRELQIIYTYYKKKGVGMKGREIRKNVLEISKLLSENPQMGQIEEHLIYKNEAHRYVLVKPNYKVIYRILNQIIYIVDVFDTRKDPGKMKG